jgi:hypothetical protein
MFDYFLVKDLITFQPVLFYLMIEILVYCGASSLLTELYWLKSYSTFYNSPLGDYYLISY